MKIVKETYYVSPIDNRLYYINDNHFLDHDENGIPYVLHLHENWRSEKVEKLYQLEDIKNIDVKLNMDERIYYISKFDGLVHNLYDWEHRKRFDDKADIGRDWHEYGMRLREQVSLWTLNEIMHYCNNYRNAP